MTKVMRVAAFVVAVLLPLTASGQSGATLTTDKTGYLAGETITISGAGFGADEPVAVKVAHTGPGAAGASDPAPWEVWADAQGAFETSWLIDPSDSPGTQFTVAAAGQTSGSSAQAAFARIAVIETDKLDYQPGEIGQISGRGFLPHELVVVDVTHVNGLVGGYGHEPFTVGADASGQITAPWFVDPVDSEGGIFLATATGSDSGLRALTIFTDSIVIIVDDAGPDDYPGQKDLNKLTIDDGNLPTALAVSWNWDDTAWSGNNTGDGCSLFDTNGNGLANYALCVSVGGSPAVFKTTTLYACSDANADRCANSAPASFSGSCNAGVVAASDPFGAIPSHTTGNQCGDSPACYTADTVAACTVQLANLGATTARLINVCSYPSAQPNSAPSECVVTPNNGFLTIVKVDNESGDSTAFTFNLGAGQASQGGTSSWTINGSGSVSSISFAPGTSYDLSEAVPSGWNLDSASCNINGTGTGTPTSTGVDNFAIQSGLETVCTFTDSKKKGSLKISKTLSNPDGASVPTSFTINYDCGGTYAGSVSVAAGGSQTVSGIPTGSSCTVSEPALTPIAGYTWGTAVVTGSPATIGYNTTVEVSVANSITRDLGSFKITKTTSNPGGATLPAAFTGTYDCGVGYTGNWSVANNGSQTVSGIPTGNACSVVETAPVPISGYTWGPITYSPTSVAISDKGGTFEIVVGNSITRDLGSFKITKSTSNPDGATLPPAFTGTYNCGGTYTGSFSVANGGSQTFGNIPTGSVCSVVETAPAPISGYTWGPITYTPATIEISTKDGTFEIVVGNSITLDRGSLKISKTLSNPDGASVPANFTINYNCGTSYIGSVSVAAGSFQTVSGIPTGSSCAVSEPALTPIAGYTWGTAVVTGSPATIGNNTTVEVSVANSITLDRGSLKISKTLSNPDGASVPANFTINYNCGTSYIGSVSVTAGSFQTVGGIPTGNTCSVVETAPAPISGYTWGPITYTPTTIVISTKGGTFEIVVGNSITRDRGSLTIVKRVINDNGGTATVSAFGLATSAGSLTFDSGVANGTTTTYTSQAITVVTANYSLYENDVYGYTEGTWSCTNGTASPTTYNSGSVYVGKDMNVVCTITNNDDPGRIVIIKNAKPAQGSFAFTTTGAGYNSFTLTGATTNSGNVNTQTLNAGTYTVKEGTQLAWYLTGIGGSSDPNTPYNCVVIGSGGSTGVGDLNTMTTTVNLKNGDTVTCTFENTGAGATRTQGFWATHPQLAQIAWFGGTAFGHTFPGVAGTSGIGNRTLCSKTIEGPGLNSPGDISKLMGGFWSDISKKSTGTKRTALDQARMQLLQQLLSAELNASAFGSVPVGGSTMFASWESSYCGTDTKKMQTALQQAATFNTAGDSSTFTPGTSADSKYARSVADIKFWDTLP